MKQIKWGILATGGIAHTFAKALTQVENAVLEGVASRTIDKAKAFADEFHANKYYGSYEALVQDKDIDVVYIASPMHKHYEDMLLCLNNNKNVLVEKTVTLNAKQFEECVALAKQKGLFLMEAMWMKFLPAFNQAKAWVKDDKIGKVKMISADFLSMVDYNPEGRLYSNALGGGALLDLGVYPLSFATSFLGFGYKAIHTAAYIGETNVDYNSSFNLIYDDSYAQLSCGFNINNQNPASIIGEKGRIVFDNWFFCAQRIWLYDRNNTLIETYEMPHRVNGYEYEIEHVQACLEKGLLQSDIVPLDHTMNILKIMDYCRAKWGLVFEGE